MNTNLGRMYRVFAAALPVLCLPVIAAAQPQKTQNVNVVNPDASPVPVKAMTTVMVKNADGPGLAPYQAYFSAVPSSSGACGGNFCSFQLPAIPEGKRLVVTDFYGAINLQTKGSINGPRLTVWDASVTKNAFEVPQNPDAFYDAPLSSGTVRYAFQSKPVMYIDAGFTAWVDFYTSPLVLLDTAIPTQITVVGYLVDVSQ